MQKSRILLVKPIMFHNSHEVNHPGIVHLTLLIQSRCTESLSNTDTAPLAQRSPGISKAVANAGLGRWRADQQSSQQHLPVREGDSHSCGSTNRTRPHLLELLQLRCSQVCASSPHQPDSREPHKAWCPSSKSLLSQMFYLLWLDLSAEHEGRLHQQDNTLVLRIK